MSAASPNTSDIRLNARLFVPGQLVQEGSVPLKLEISAGSDATIEIASGDSWCSKPVKTTISVFANRAVSWGANFPIHSDISILDFTFRVKAKSSASLVYRGKTHDPVRLRGGKSGSTYVFKDILVGESSSNSGDAIESTNRLDSPSHSSLVVNAGEDEPHINVGWVPHELEITRDAVGKRSNAGGAILVLSAAIVLLVAALVLWPSEKQKVENVSKGDTQGVLEPVEKEDKPASDEQEAAREELAPVKEAANGKLQDAAIPEPGDDTLQNDSRNLEPTRELVSRKIISDEPVSEPEFTPVSESVIEVGGGGHVRVSVTPKIVLGQKCFLNFESNTDVYLQIVHWGTGVGSQQFFPNAKEPDSLLKSGEPMVIEFLAHPPAGINHFFVYASLAEYQDVSEDGQNLPEVPKSARSRGPAEIVEILSPKTIPSSYELVNHTTVSYQSIEPK